MIGTHAANLVIGASLVGPIQRLFQATYHIADTLPVGDTRGVPWLVALNVDE
jgi:hypothetical protein